MMQRKKSRIGIIAAGVALVLTCSAAIGQELGSLEWFEKEWEAASKWTVPDFTLFEFQATGHRYVTQDEVRALAALIDGKPEHPKRRVYEQKLADLRVPNPSGRTRVWFGSDGFRRSAYSDPNGANVEYPEGYRVDDVLRKKVKWTLQGDLLGVFNPRVASQGQEYAARREASYSHPRRFVLGGMGGSTRVKHRIISSLVDENGRWRGETESMGGTLAVDWTGTLDEEHDVILVESSTVTKADGTEFLLNTHWEYTDWTYSDYFEKPIAHKVVRFDRKGRPINTMELIGFSKFAPGEFKALTRVPSHEVPDVIRGDTSHITISDTRPSVEEIRVVLPDGNLEVRSLARDDKQKSGWRGRIIGMLVASIAIGGVWVVYCRRR